MCTPAFQKKDTNSFRQSMNGDNQRQWIQAMIQLSLNVSSVNLNASWLSSVQINPIYYNFFRFISLGERWARSPIEGKAHVNQTVGQLLDKHSTLGHPKSSMWMIIQIYVSDQISSFLQSLLGKTNVDSWIRVDICSDSNNLD